MNRDTLIERMVGALRAALDTQGDDHDLVAEAESPLIGGSAILSSLALVTYILDVEALLEAEEGLQVTLVNESALSRSESPFRTVSTLADYVLELAGVEVSTPVDDQRVARA